MNQSSEISRGYRKRRVKEFIKVIHEFLIKIFPGLTIVVVVIKGSE